jgi:hypothetical protein
VYLADAGQLPLYRLMDGLWRNVLPSRRDDQILGHGSPLGMRINRCSSFYPPTFGPTTFPPTNDYSKKLYP